MVMSHLLVFISILFQVLSGMVLLSLRGSAEHNCKLLGCPSFSILARMRMTIMTLLDFQNYGADDNKKSTISYGGSTALYTRVQ